MGADPLCGTGRVSTPRACLKIRRWAWTPATRALRSSAHGRRPRSRRPDHAAELDVNPYPIYRALREQRVVWICALERWMVTMWDDVGHAETAQESFSANETHANLTRIIGSPGSCPSSSCTLTLRSATDVRRRTPTSPDPVNVSAARRPSSVNARESLIPCGGPEAVCTSAALGRRKPTGRALEERWVEAFKAGGGVAPGGGDEERVSIRAVGGQGVSDHRGCGSFRVRTRRGRQPMSSRGTAERVDTSAG